MKKITVALLVMAMLAVFAGCGEKPLSEAELRGLLEAEITLPILDFWYDDYDGNGAFEAFAFVGEEQNPEMDEGYRGEIWFVNCDGAQQLEASPHGIYWGLIDTYRFDGRNFAAATTFAQTGGLVNIWGVYAGEPRHESISNIGGGLKQIDDKNFTLWHSAYDFDVTDGVTTGHTWKDYWFYWDGEAFHEYGGAAVTEEQLRKCDGAAEILDAIIATGETIGDIFYRGNGIINVNHLRTYESGRSNYHTILQLSGTEVTVVEVEGNGGFYLPALAPGIAVCPELPEIFA